LCCWSRELGARRDRQPRALCEDVCRWAGVNSAPLVGPGDVGTTDLSSGVMPVWTIGDLAAPDLTHFTLERAGEQTFEPH